MCKTNEADENPIVKINGLRVRRQDGTEVLRCNKCEAEENETVLDQFVVDPDFDENYADAVEQQLTCYVCEGRIDALYPRN